MRFSIILLLGFILSFISCSNSSDLNNVYLDSTVASTHVSIYDKNSDSTSLFAKFNDKEINITSLFKTYHLGDHVNLEYILQNCGNGNFLLSGSNFCFVIHNDSIHNCILSPILAIDSINSKLLYDNRADSLVFSIFDIQNLKKSDFTIKDINDSLYYTTGIYAKFDKKGILHVKYYDKNKIEKDSVIDKK